MNQLKTLDELTLHESGGLSKDAIDPATYADIESCMRAVAYDVKVMHGKESSCIFGFDPHNDLSLLLRIIKCGCCTQSTYDYYDFSGHRRPLKQVLGLVDNHV